MSVCAWQTWNFNQGSIRVLTTYKYHSHHLWCSPQTAWENVIPCCQLVITPIMQFSQGDSSESGAFSPDLHWCGQKLEVAIYKYGMTFEISPVVLSASQTADRRDATRMEETSWTLSCVWPFPGCWRYLVITVVGSEQFRVHLQVRARVAE